MCDFQNEINLSSPHGLGGGGSFQEKRKLNEIHDKDELFCFREIEIETILIIIVDFLFLWFYDIFHLLDDATNL